MSEATTSDSKVQYRPFGIFRFGLASMVVISHTHILGGKGISQFLAPYGLGNIAVMSFFILSGFVIAEAAVTFYAGRPWAFLANRFLRIFPPFFVALGFSILVHYLLATNFRLVFFDDISNADTIFDIRNISSNVLSLILLYGLGLLGFSPDYLFVRFTWAVAVELHFYYAAAFLLSLSTASILSVNISKARFWFLVGGCLAVLFIASLVSGFHRFYYFAWTPYFLCGIMAYLILVRDYRLSHMIAISITSLAAVNIHAFLYISRNPAAQVLSTLIILNLIAIIIWGLGRLTAKNWLKAVDRWAGDVTYPLYLNHYAVSIATLSIFNEESTGPLLFLANYFLSVIISFLLMYITEPATRNLRTSIRGSSL